jgi:hypothetical protein
VDPTPVFARNDAIFLPDGTLLQTHSEDECIRAYCSIHNPSDHPLRDAPQLWNSRFKTMHRMCDHGYVHLDPDDFMFKWRMGLSLATLAIIRRHDCDDCCRWPNVDEDDVR